MRRTSCPPNTNLVCSMCCTVKLPRRRCIIIVLSPPPRFSLFIVHYVLAVLFSSCFSILILKATMSSSFREFVSVLGEEVDLLNFEGYNGGLDVTAKLVTGPKAIHAKIPNSANTVMYHVAPLIPARGPSDPLRKRYLLNQVTFFPLHVAISVTMSLFSFSMKVDAPLTFR